MSIWQVRRLGTLLFCTGMLIGASVAGFSMGMIVMEEHHLISHRIGDEYILPLFKCGVFGLLLMVLGVLLKDDVVEYLEKKEERKNRDALRAEGSQGC